MVIFLRIIILLASLPLFIQAENVTIEDINKLRQEIAREAEQNKKLQQEYLQKKQEYEAAYAKLQSDLAREQQESPKRQLYSRFAGLKKSTDEAIKASQAISQKSDETPNYFSLKIPFDEKVASQYKLSDYDKNFEPFLADVRRIGRNIELSLYEYDRVRIGFKLLQDGFSNLYKSTLTSHPDLSSTVAILKGNEPNFSELYNDISRVEDQLRQLKTNYEKLEANYLKYYGEAFAKDHQAFLAGLEKNKDIAIALTDSKMAIVGYYTAIMLKIGSGEYYEAERQIQHVATFKTILSNLYKPLAAQDENIKPVAEMLFQHLDQKIASLKETLNKVPREKWLPNQELNIRLLYKGLLKSQSKMNSAQLALFKTSEQKWIKMYPQLVSQGASVKLRSLYLTEIGNDLSKSVP